jgi:YQGE family putative transporter
MVASLVRRFMTMRPSVRALVFLYWIYAFASGLVGIFVQIFLYQKFTSIPLNMLATMANYTGIMLGFGFPGLAAARFRLNLKGGFFWSFLITGGALSLLLFINSVTSALWVMLLWGFGQGMYWLTVNTFELSETKDAERDFYSSMLNAGNQILSLLGPAASASLIWLSGSVLHLGTFTLLFIAAPLVYLLGFFCFSSIRDYRPQPVTCADVTHYFTDRRNVRAQLYTGGMGFQQALGVTVPPLAVLFVLGTALRVGLYNMFFAIFSALCILAVAQYRTHENRLKIYGVTTLGLVSVITLFGYLLNFIGLVIYTFFEGVLSPLNNVSSHVTDLASMEIGRGESDFYATMILRDFMLWVWRMLGGAVFLSLVTLFTNERGVLSAGLYLLSGGLVLTYTGAYLFVKSENR